VRPVAFVATDGPMLSATAGRSAIIHVSVMRSDRRKRDRSGQRGDERREPRRAPDPPSGGGVVPNLGLPAGVAALEIARDPGGGLFERRQASR
jgi:hypothetical protein